MSNSYFAYSHPKTLRIRGQEKLISYRVMIELIMCSDQFKQTFLCTLCIYRLDQTTTLKVIISGKKHFNVFIWHKHFISLISSNVIFCKVKQLIKWNNNFQSQSASVFEIIFLGDIYLANFFVKLKLRAHFLFDAIHLS